MISPKKCLLSSVAALSLLGMPLSSTAQTGSATEPKVQPKIEPQAIAILKAMGERLAATRSLKFTAVTTYESPSRIGPPLLYSTTSEVTLQRPNKLRVITPGDGPATAFYLSSARRPPIYRRGELRAISK